MNKPLLKKGSKGPDVVELQNLLIKEGMDLEPYGADGDFGSTTVTAVKSFQVKSGLDPDGVVGKNTWGMLLKEYSSSDSELTPWVNEGLALVGVHEVRDESAVHQMWRDAKLSGLAKVSASKVPWCSGFACACMENVGIRSPRSDSSRAWVHWEQGLDEPCYGCVVVFSRTGGGHVGFVVGVSESGNLLVLGGNQGNSVNIKEFPRSRVIAYQLPEGIDPSQLELKVGGSAEVSDNES